MKEKDLYKYYKKWILDTDPNAWIYVTRDMSSIGIPDIHATVKGKSVWIELKHKHKLQPLQFASLVRIEQAGGIGLIGRDGYVCSPKHYNMKTQRMDMYSDIKLVSLGELIDRKK